jgi:uncharacterized RDD family membrane protein YckC
MHSIVPRGDATTGLPRAGFWRRILSIIIDFIIVMLPFQILAAVLFALTAGMVQMNGGLTLTTCENGTEIPGSLDPPPPHDSNFTRVCRTSLFGATTGAVLTVGRVTRKGATTTTVNQSYALDKNGTPIRATSIDSIVDLVLLAYLVGMVWKSGRTLGARVVGVRVVDAEYPDTPGVPLRKAIIRYLAMFVGALPACALWVYRYVVAKGSADAMFTADAFRWFTITAIVGALWTIVLIIQIVSKRDPVYDRLAGTAVLLTGNETPR